MLGVDMVPDSSTTPKRPTSPTRRRVARGVRTALRWGLLGGACCFLSWCGLTAMSAGTAEAATGGSHGLTSTVTEQTPVKRLVSDLDASTSRLVNVAHVRDDVQQHAVTDAGDVATDVAKATGGNRPTSQKSVSTSDLTETSDLGRTVNRLTTVAASSMQRIGVPTQGLVAGAEDPVSTITAETGTDGQLADPNGADGSTLGAQSDGTASQADAADHRASGERGAGAHRSGDTEHASSGSADGDAPIAAADGNDRGGNSPVQPSDPGTHTSSTTSSSSSGSSSHDGGAGVRSHACKPSCSGGTLIAPSVDGVDVPWNAAGKPRISPD